LETTSSVGLNASEASYLSSSPSLSEGHPLPSSSLSLAYLFMLVYLFNKLPIMLGILGI
jgi:hypothetical protein